MKNHFSIKSSFIVKIKLLILPLMLLTFGVGEMWGVVICSLGEAKLQCRFNGARYKFGNSGDDNDYYYVYNTSSHSAHNLGTLTTDSFSITNLTWHCWNDWNSDEGTNNYFWYSINSGSTTTWGPQSWNGHSDFWPYNTTPNITVAKSTDASGEYKFHHGWYTRFYEYDSSGYTQKDLNNSGSFQFTYTILPPACLNDTITVVPVSNLVSGTGTEDDPFVIANGASTSFRVSATQGHSDANSSLYVKFGAGEYSSATTSGTYDHSAEKASVTIYAKFYNSTASLSGTATTKTIYYIEQPAGITITAGTGGTVSKDNSSFSSNVQYTDISFSTNYYIYAKADDHYQFSAWTKGTNSSNTTIADASSASTTVSVSSGAVTTVTATFTEVPYIITIVGGTTASTTAKIVTTGTATAQVPFGKDFSSWTIPAENFELVGCSATDQTITFRATAAGTVTANFSQRYAFVEGRFHVTNSSRNGTWTNTFSDGDWNENSTNIKFDYDETYDYYKLHTYATPKELTTSIESQTPYFYIKTSSSSSSLENVTIHRAYNSDASYAQLTSSGDGNKRLASKSDGTHSFYFNNSSDESGYVVLALKKFNGTPYIYYWLEQSVQYDANGGTGDAPAALTYYDYSTSNTVQAAANTYTRAGYSFTGWNTAANGIGADITANAWFAPSANKTLYAQWSENDYTVTVSATSGGSITTPASPATTVTAHPATTASISASPTNGYYFKQWEVVSGTVTIASASSASTTITATTDGTVRAVFEPIWRLVGSGTELGEWSTTANEFTTYHATVSPNRDSSYIEIDLAANTEYRVKMVEQSQSGSTYYGYASSGEHMYYSSNHYTRPIATTPGNDFYIHTAGSGSYTFTWDKTNKTLSVLYPTSRYITMGTKSYFVDATTSASSAEASDISTTGGSMTAIDNSSNTVTNKSFVLDNATVTFTAAPTAGYTLEGWYNNSDYAAEHKIADGGNYDIDGNTLTVSSITANLSVYAKFVENTTTVTLVANGPGHITCGGETVTSITTGVTTTRSLTAVCDNSNYYFAGWTLSGSADFSLSGTGEDDTNPTLTGEGTGTTGEVLTANFYELDKVYFRNWDAENNRALWTDVYAYFSIYYENSEGTACAKSNTSSAYSGIKMTQEGTSNIYWAYVPRGTTRNNDYDIAFSNHNFGTNYKFSGYEAVMRGDYKSGLDLFVPTHSSNYTRNSTKYYNGYWKHHNAEKGGYGQYYMLRYAGGESYDNADDGNGNCQFLVVDENTIQFSLRIDNMDTDYNRYKINSNKGISYITNNNGAITGYTVSVSDCSDISMTEYTSSTPTFHITPVSQGYYIVTIDQSGDVMKLSVDYPLASGDYILVHTYTDAAGTHTRYSDIIKASEVADGAKKTVSMFIGKAATSPSLTLKKCTGFSDGVPTWSSGNAVDLSGFTNGNRVYKFDIGVSSDIGTASNIGLYTGSYYIKTNGATGGWTAYTSNVLSKNAVTYSRSDSAKSFDYYYCKFLSQNTNVKCVIANDYCNALSDTLVQDATYLYANGGSSREYLPADASVRFSYNSYTNTLKRTFIGSSANNNFLVLRGDGSSTNALYAASDAVSSIQTGGNSSGTATANYAKFADTQNWIYDLTVYADLSAHAKLVACYNGQEQYFKGQSGDFSTEGNYIVLGGTSDESRHEISMLYDFKTDKLTAGVSLPSTVTSDISVNEILYSRTGDAIDNEITISSGKAMAVNHMTMAMNITKAAYDAWTDDDDTDEGKVMYFWVSLPYECKVSDIYGFGTSNVDWEIQRYRGDRRARGGWPTEFLWSALTTLATMSSNEGYVLAIRLKSSDFVVDGKEHDVTLYFPSSGSVTLASTAYSYLPYYSGSTQAIQQNWHIMGVPIMANGKDFKHLSGSTSPTDEAKLTAAGLSTSAYTRSPFTMAYKWSWDNGNRMYDPVQFDGSFNFEAGVAYMIQGSGVLEWSYTAEAVHAPLRATQRNQTQYYELDLLSEEEKVLDKMYVRYSEDGTTEYDMGRDLEKIMNAGRSMLYTSLSYNQAALCLPLDDQQLIPLTVVANEDGEYTLHVKKSSGGAEPILYDTEADMTTLLLHGDYTVELNAGTYTDRFFLGVNRTQDTATDLGNYELQITNNEGQADKRPVKFIQDGVMYILIDGKVYDATGQRR